MKRAIPFQEPVLFNSMNVTPFIDVMLVLLVLLVLLVMLIITIPIQSHIVKIDLPAKAVSEAGLPHKLAIDAAGTVYWDGSEVTDSALPELLEATVYEDADLQVQTDPAARYERFDQVLAIVKQSGITKLGFVGNEHMSL